MHRASEKWLRRVMALTLALGLIHAPSAVRGQAGSDDALRRELDAVKEQLRRVEQQMKQQEELIRKLTAPPPVAAPPAVTAPPAVATPPAQPAVTPDVEALKRQILAEIQPSWPPPTRPCLPVQSGHRLRRRHGRLQQPEGQAELRVPLRRARNLREHRPLRAGLRDPQRDQRRRGGRGSGDGDDVAAVQPHRQGRSVLCGLRPAFHLSRSRPAVREPAARARRPTWAASRRRMASRRTGWCRSRTTSPSRQAPTTRSGPRTTVPATTCRAIPASSRTWGASRPPST